MIYYSIDICKQDGDRLIKNKDKIILKKKNLINDKKYVWVNT